MADELSPNYTRSRALMNYFNQRLATSGKTPSKWELGDIIKAEAEAAAKNARESRYLTLQEKSQSALEDYRRKRIAMQQKAQDEASDAQQWNKWAGIAAPVTSIIGADFVKNGSNSMLGKTGNWFSNLNKNMNDAPGVPSDTKNDLTDYYENDWSAFSGGNDAGVNAAMANEIASFNSGSIGGGSYDPYNSGLDSVPITDQLGDMNDYSGGWSWLDDLGSFDDWSFYD